jgi:hypothetical protein
MGFTNKIGIIEKIKMGITIKIDIIKKINKIKLNKEKLDKICNAIRSGKFGVSVVETISS